MKTEPATARPQMNAVQWAMLVSLGVLWGGSFFFARIAVAELPPLTLVLLRVVIAAAALHLWLLWHGPSFATARGKAAPLALLGLLNNAVPFSLIFAGQTAMGAGLASVFNATTPFWTLILANLFTADEKLTAGKVTGVALGIVGTGLMFGPGVEAGLAAPLWAKLALIGASLSYAVSLLLARRALKGVPPVLIATGQLTASSLIMLPVVAAVGGFAAIGQVSPPVWAAVIALALASTALAYLLYFRLVAEAGATNASLVTLVVPASAILLGTLFLGETMGPAEWAGLAAIVCGLLVIDGRLGFPARRG